MEDRCTLRRERKYIRAKMKGYTPCPQTLVRDLKRLYDIGQWGTRFPLEFVDTADEPSHFLWDPAPTRSGIQNDFLAYPIWEYVWERNAFGIATRVDLPKTVERFKHLADDRYIWNQMPEFRRTMRRTSQIHDELLAAYPRMQAILACHRIKEDLYKNVYHPRRIERLLEVGGWEALENFAGL